MIPPFQYKFGKATTLLCSAAWMDHMQPNKLNETDEIIL